MFDRVMFDLKSMHAAKHGFPATNTVWFGQLQRRSPVPNYRFEFHVCRA